MYVLINGYLVIYYYANFSVQLHISLKTRTWKGKCEVSAGLSINKIDEEMTPSA